MYETIKRSERLHIFSLSHMQYGNRERVKQKSAMVQLVSSSLKCICTALSHLHCFIIVLKLILMFCDDALMELGSHYTNPISFLCMY